MIVDVVIATYNRANQISETLDNVLQYKDDINKIFVVNNNSEDNTKEVLKEFHDNEKIEIIHSPENLGASGGKNIGLKKSVADVAIVIDDDAIFFSDNPIQEVKKIFSDDKKIGIIQFQIVNFQSRKILRHEFPGDNPQQNGDKEFLSGYFIGAGHAIRNSMLEKVGYYPNDFFYAHEEIDLSYRAVNGGYIIKYCPIVGVYHKKVQSGRLPHNRVLLNMYKNRLIMSYQYLPNFYKIISNMAWFIKTVLDSRSITIALSAIKEFNEIKDSLKIDKLSENAIKYMKKYNGRLYR